MRRTTLVGVLTAFLLVGGLGLSARLWSAATCCRFGVRRVDAALVPESGVRSASGGIGACKSGDASPHAIDEESLKQTSWMGQVQENIRKAEYNITYQEKCVVEGEPGGLYAANRANNLRAYFREDGLHLMPRETSNPEWQLRYRFTAWSRKTGTVPGKTGTDTSERVFERDVSVPALHAAERDVSVPAAAETKNGDSPEWH